MKPEIHPEYFPAAQVNCSCGNSWVTGSTTAEINVNICSSAIRFIPVSNESSIRSAGLSGL